MKKLIYLLAVIFLLGACGLNQNAGSDKSSEADEPLYPADVEMRESDFVYRLFTEKDIYGDLDDVAIIAELTYVGDEESIKINHAGSLFFLPLEERTHGNKIDYAVTHQLIVRTLQKGVPFRVKRVFDEEHVEYAKTLMHEGFPEGKYIIRGLAQFGIGDPSDTTDEHKFNMKADIGFTVKKSVNE